MEIIQNKRKKCIVIVLIIMLLTAVCVPVLATEQVYNEEKISVKSLSNKLFNLLQRIRNILNNLISKLKLMLERIKKPAEKIELENDLEISFGKLENNKQNMIYSPLSIKYALSMLKEGANGNTKEQIEKLLGDEELTKYNNIDKILSLANSIYIRDTYKEHVKEDYKNELIEKYNAEVNYDSFKNADNMNTWIENKTFGIIKNMIKDELVQNPDSKMVLINALAIDMEWAEGFSERETIGKEFYLEDGSNIIATTMNKKTYSDGISYYKDDEITALTMDLKKYDDTQLEFVAIMPEKDLSNYVKDFKMEEIDNIIEKATLASETKAGLKISIPKFSFEYDLKLKDDLRKLGITDAFETGVADFSNMSDEKFHVGEALHKANIDFTEKGIKAAAVTVILMKDNCAMVDKLEVEEINMNKPFLYIIRDKDTGEVWFVGTLYEPNLWEKDKDDYKPQTTYVPNDIIELKDLFEL